METDHSELWIQERSDKLLAIQQEALWAQTDRMFAKLLPAQWIVAILFAVIVSPRRWEGAMSQVHIHVWTALILGGLITLFPTFLGLTQAGKALTRYVIACAQMLMSALLIHLTGGRIETHFHVFGSLAFVAFYRDWKLLIPATIVVATDHLVRGIFWPQSVYGIINASPWRFLEHAGWVIFEDIILIRLCLLGASEMRILADRQARLEDINENIENRVLLRTSELKENEERFRGIVASAPVGILQIDPSGQCVYTNEQYQNMCGRSEAQLKGRGWIETVYPQDQEEASKLGTSKKAPSDAPKKLRILKSGGEPHWVFAHSKTLRLEGGTIAGQVITIEDSANGLTN